MTIREEIVINGERYGCECTLPEVETIQPSKESAIRAQLRRDLEEYKKTRS